MGIHAEGEYRRRKKIREIYAQIDRVLRGDYTTAFEEYQEGDLSILQNQLHKLVIRLNEQAVQLGQDKRYLMNAMADISHQLKTPLTSVNIILSFLMEEKLTYEERLHLSGKLSNALSHVEELITTLLKLSKFDAGVVQFQNASVSVKELADTVSEGMAVQLELKEVLLTYDIAENVSFTGDFQWTKEALENIVKNCMEHTLSGGQIQKIRFTRKSSCVTTEQEFKKKIYHTCLSGFTVAKERKIQEWVSDFHWQQRLSAGRTER